MKSFVSWLYVIVWAAFIFYMSHQPSVDMPSFPYSDKVMHVGAYAVLGYFIARAIIKNYQLPFAKMMMIALMAAGIYGLSDEFHQMFVPTRSADMFDLLADFVGGFLGALFYGYLPFIIKRN